MEVIIIAAIALLVLVILTVLVLRAGGGIGEGTGCIANGGTCSDTCDEGSRQSGHACSTAGEVCCMSLTFGNADEG